MCQEASDMFGSGKYNSAFKMGAEWCYKEMEDLVVALQWIEKQFDHWGTCFTQDHADGKCVCPKGEAKRALDKFNALI